MLTFVRARTSSVAAALLVSLLSLQLPHPVDADHDSHESLALLAHDPSSHAVRDTLHYDGAPPLHCVACHFARSFRLQTDAPSLPAPLVSAGTHAHLDVFTAACPAVSAQPPLRAPPASPSLTFA